MIDTAADASADYDKEAVYNPGGKLCCRMNGREFFVALTPDDPEDTVQADEEAAV
ncbi:MAG: hypothetical protein ACOCWH_05525 [Spirochaetota bacterium]